MATTYLPGAPRPANPSRRAIIGAASLAIPMAAMAASPIIRGPRREWDRLVGEFHAADAKMKTIGVAEDSFMAGRKLLGERPEPPRVVYPLPIEDMTVGQLRDLSAPAHEQEKYDADLASWQAKYDELGERTIGDLEDRWNDAVSEQDDAAHAVFAYPAPDRAALLFKLDLAERAYHGSDLDSAVAKQICADVRRFLRGEA